MGTSLSFIGSAEYYTVNTTTGGMRCSGNILSIQLDPSYTVLNINSSNNCIVTLSEGLLLITASGFGSSGVYGNGNAHGPSIEFSYDIVVSCE